MLYTEILARNGEYAPEGWMWETVELTWQDRRKRRIRATTDQGREVGITLPQGGLLRDGDLLGPGTSPALLIRAAKEQVLVIWPRTVREMGRVAHQIGNRHMQAWIGEDGIVVLDDPVLAGQLTADGVPHSRELRALNDDPEESPAGHHAHDR